MLNISKEDLARLDKDYPGIAERIMEFDKAELPACPHCGSLDTAVVQVGLGGRTMGIAAATTKVKLLANGPKPGTYFCNSCKSFFK